MEDRHSWVSQQTTLSQCRGRHLKNGSVSLDWCLTPHPSFYLVISEIMIRGCCLMLSMIRIKEDSKSSHYFVNLVVRHAGSDNSSTLIPLGYLPPAFVRSLTSLRSHYRLWPTFSTSQYNDLWIMIGDTVCRSPNRTSCRLLRCKRRFCQRT